MTLLGVRMIQFDANNVPGRIILSRKGFDGSSGGCCPSPIFEDDRMLSLPIHESKQNTAMTYGSIPALAHSQFSNLGDVVENLPGCLMESCNHAHLDPDIRPEMRPPDAD